MIGKIWKIVFLGSKKKFGVGGGGGGDIGLDFVELSSNCKK